MCIRDRCICNGENSAEGNGLGYDSAQMLLQAGVDVITTGNHLFKKREALSLLEEMPHVVRPLNYTRAPGCGWYLFDSIRGQVCVVSLMGTVFMDGLPRDVYKRQPRSWGCIAPPTCRRRRCG